MNSMFTLVKHTNSILKSIKGFGDILENNCAMDQHDEVLHSTINFDILIKGDNNLQLKIKDHDNNFIVLNNIRNLRFTLRNNKEEIRDISSFGWRKVLDCAEGRHITIKINGILDSVLADELLRNSAMLSSNNDYETSFNAKEKIKLRCSVELYERYYDPAAFDSFAVVLASAEVVRTFH